MRRPHLPRLALLVGCAVLLSACAADGGSGGQDVELSGGVWQLAAATLDDEDVVLPDGAEVTLEVVDDQAAGKAACNRYGASVTVEGASVAFGQARSTLMACEEPLMRLEGAYLKALERVERASRDGGSLELTGPGVRLVFALG